MKNLLHNKTFLITLAVVVVAAVAVGIGLSLSSSPKPTTATGSSSSTAPQKASSTAIVEITPSGFLPSTIQVKPDTEVVWVNEDTQPHLPAAAPYPTHKDLPSLVAPKALGEKETYSYLFTRAGTIHYQDDLNPTFTAQVVVE